MTVWVRDGFRKVGFHSTSLPFSSTYVEAPSTDAIMTRNKSSCGVIRAILRSLQPKVLALPLAPHPFHLAPIFGNFQALLCPRKGRRQILPLPPANTLPAHPHLPGFPALLVTQPPDVRRHLPSVRASGQTPPRVNGREQDFQDLAPKTWSPGLSNDRNLFLDNSVLPSYWSLRTTSWRQATRERKGPHQILFLRRQ